MADQLKPGWWQSKEVEVTATISPSEQVLRSSADAIDPIDRLWAIRCSLRHARLGTIQIESHHRNHQE